MIAHLLAQMGSRTEALALLNQIQETGDEPPVTD